jgi:hypothetical protein
MSGPRPEDFPGDFPEPIPGDELDDLPKEGATLDLSIEETGWDRQSQELAYLLATAISRLGGCLVITREERMKALRYSLGFDVKFEAEAGGIRIFAVLKEAGE